MVFYEQLELFDLRPYTTNCDKKFIISDVPELQNEEDVVKPTEHIQLEPDLSPQEFDGN